MLGPAYASARPAYPPDTGYNSMTPHGRLAEWYQPEFDGYTSRTKVRQVDTKARALFRSRMRDFDKGGLPAQPDKKYTITRQHRALIHDAGIRASLAPAERRWTRTATTAIRPSICPMHFTDLTVIERRRTRSGLARQESAPKHEVHQFRMRTSDWSGRSLSIS